MEFNTYWRDYLSLHPKIWDWPPEKLEAVREVCLVLFNETFTSQDELDELKADNENLKDEVSELENEVDDLEDQLTKAEDRLESELQNKPVIKEKLRQIIEIADSAL